MSEVVLRCPHCGTTRGTPGECEACHEDQVRYYCTNHNPGRWLDTPACPHCGARFGAPPRRPPPPPAPAPSPRPGTPGGARPPAPLRRPGPMAGGAGAGSAGARRPTGRDGRAPPPDEIPVAFPTWADLLRHAERTRRERAARTEAPVGGGPRLGGCLLRLVLLFLLMLFFLFSGLFMFAGSLFQLFRVF